MPVRFAGLEPGGIACMKRLLAIVGRQNDRARQNIDELVTVQMPMPLSRPRAGGQTKKCNPDLVQARRFGKSLALASGARIDKWPRIA